MAETDKKMPRFFEDWIPVNTIHLAPGRTKDNYDVKKTLRRRKP